MGMNQKFAERRQFEITGGGWYMELKENGVANTYIWCCPLGSSIHSKQG